MQTQTAEVVHCRRRHRRHGLRAGVAGSGAPVLLLDRDQAEKLGGLARESFGGMFAVDTPDNAGRAYATRLSRRWPTGRRLPSLTRRRSGRSAGPAPMWPLHR